MSNWIPGVGGLSPDELTSGGIDTVDNVIGGTGEFLGGFSDAGGNLIDSTTGGIADNLEGFGDWTVSGASSTVGDLWSGGTEGVGEGVGNVTGGFGTKALLIGGVVAAAAVFGLTRGN